MANVLRRLGLFILLFLSMIEILLLNGKLKSSGDTIVKGFHILVNFIGGDIRVNLCRLNLTVTEHPTNRFDRYTL